METATAFERVWQKQFSTQERAKLKPAIDEHGMVTAWQHVRGGSEWRAVLDIARSISLIAEDDYNWLLAEVGEKPAPDLSQAGPAVDAARNPRWDRTTGELWFGEKVCGKFRIMAVTSTSQTILDGFEAASWQGPVANPIANCAPSNLYQALSRLNRGVEGIRFHAQNGGKAIGWSETQVNSK